MQSESAQGKGGWIRVAMGEARKRQFQEICRQLGLPVVGIVGIRIGMLRLGNLESLKDYLTLPAKIRLIPDPGLPPRSKPVTPHGPPAWLELKLREGKNRQIRHMTAAVGLRTLRLVRAAMGKIRLGSLKSGEWASSC